jgi:hypothetical protein
MEVFVYSFCPRRSLQFFFTGSKEDKLDFWLWQWQYRSFWYWRVTSNLSSGSQTSEVKISEYDYFRFWCHQDLMQVLAFKTPASLFTIICSLAYKIYKNFSLLSCALEHTLTKLLFTNQFYSNSCVNNTLHNSNYMMKN